MWLDKCRLICTSFGDMFFGRNNFGFVQTFATIIWEGSSAFSFVKPAPARQRCLSFAFYSGSSSIRRSVFVIPVTHTRDSVRCKPFVNLYFVGCFPFRWDLLSILRNWRWFQGPMARCSHDSNRSCIIQFKHSLLGSDLSKMVIAKVISKNNGPC